MIRRPPSTILLKTLVTEAGIRVSEDTGLNKQRTTTTTTGQVIRRMLEDKVVVLVPPDCNDWFLYIIFRDTFIAACIAGFVVVVACSLTGINP